MPEETKKAVNRNKGSQYVNLETKGKLGDYSDLVPPLDFLILEKLPEVGELAFGLYPQGESAKNLAKTFKPLSPTDLAMRLRIMQNLGLVIRVTMLSRTKEGWQRTKKGKQVYESWKAENTK